MVVFELKYSNMATKKTHSKPEHDVLPTPEKFFKSTPLYQSFSFNDEEVFKVAKIIYFSGTLDSYCIDCEREATFNRTIELPTKFDFEKWKKLNVISVSSPITYPILEPATYEITLQCTRNNTHFQQFIILVHRKRIIMDDKERKKIGYVNTFQKIGQYPSLADIHIPGIKKYAPILGKERFRELSKSIGLAAHDVGIGAYVYLRRVFESLIEEAHEEAKEEKADQWDEEKYQQSRMTEKVGILKNQLPEFLVENPVMYSLLSKGIHELNEEDCLKHFNTLKICIELILDEKIKKKEREVKIKEARKALGQAADEITE